MEDFKSIGLSIHKKLLATLNRKKGKGMPLSRYICTTLEEALDIPERERTKY